MKTSLYNKLAWTNIKKNAKLYIPYIITGIGLVSMYYILHTLSNDPRVSNVKGGSLLPVILFLGVIVVGIMSFILILYTNSFIMKQRAQEFGLYNVLGMGKRHICKLLCFELTYCLMFILLGGILTGIVLYKFCVLIICNLLKIPTILGFYHISPETIIPVVLIFVAFYALALIINCIRISVLNPIKLINSSKQGEREPKIRWFLLVIGVLTLVSGYMISILTTNPTKSISSFFLAVILVIIGTYCLFITGITAFLKMLRKNEKYYYQPKHMISISNLLYRMKQNAVGLASITIMATMVLVMISSTIGLYYGIEDTVKEWYPHHIQIYAEYYDENGENISVAPEEIINILNENASKIDLEIQDSFSIYSFKTELIVEDDTLKVCEDQSLLDTTIAPVMSCTFYSTKDYELLNGTKINLADDEMAMFISENNNFPVPSKLSIEGIELTCIANITASQEPLFQYAQCDVVINDINTIKKLQKALEKYDPIFVQRNSPFYRVYIDFADTKDANEKIQEYSDLFYSQINDYIQKESPDHNGYGAIFDDYFSSRNEMYAVFGSLLFLGIMLSIVFLFATALVIYYKQISEGHEDRKRFQIMLKVGMSEEETKATVKSQLIMLFLLPLVVAAIHTAFATPILIRFFNVVLMCSPTLYITCAVGALLVFAIIYCIIYKVTAKIYYQIVK